MPPSRDLNPVFVHASTRSGSTYFYNVLRRNESLICFNEAIADGKRDLPWFKEFRERKIARGNAGTWNVNHLFLERDDNEEFFEAWDEVMHLCPAYPEMRGFFPLQGELPDDLVNYLAGLMTFARSRGRRAALCEVSSRGRAGALRGVFGGFHIAQYRNPISQFGSYLRGLIDGNTWDFLVGAMVELNTSSGNGLTRLVPEKWRPPALPWQTGSRAQFWASRMRYQDAVATARPEAVEDLFRWHMFAWVLSNLVAVSYSDLSLDIDKVHDDADYRASVGAALNREIAGREVDFSDIRRFDRYYEFDLFDVAAVCDQVISVIRSAAADGRIEVALRALAKQPPVIPTASAVELLLGKISSSVAAMKASADRTRLSREEWKELAAKNQKIWFNPGLRRIAALVHPVAFPLIRTARLMGVRI